MSEHAADNISLLPLITRIAKVFSRGQMESLVRCDESVSISQNWNIVAPATKLARFDMSFARRILGY